MSDYGTLAGVGSLVPLWSGDDHDFAATTNPAAATVTRLLEQISGVVNSVLAEHGFTTPIATPADVNAALDGFVDQEVAAIVAGLRGSGRFGASSKSLAKQGYMGMISKDVADFVELSKTGFEQLGSARSRDSAEGIGALTSDASGDEVVPLFQREAYGNVVQDWDS